MVDCRDIGKNLVIISLLIGLGQKALAQRTAFPTGWNNNLALFTVFQCRSSSNLLD